MIYAMLSSENAYIYFSFCLCYMGVQICGNLNAENKMWDIGKGTYLVVGNSIRVRRTTRPLVSPEIWGIQLETKDI